MSMLNAIKQFISEHPEHKDIIVKTVIRYQEIRSEWLEGRCAICNVILSPAEQASIQPIHFSYTCFSHRKYANVFQVDIIRKRLGIPLGEWFDRKSLEELL